MTQKEFNSLHDLGITIDEKRYIQLLEGKLQKFINDGVPYGIADEFFNKMDKLIKLSENLLKENNISINVHKDQNEKLFSNLKEIAPSIDKLEIRVNENKNQIEKIEKELKIYQNTSKQIKSLQEIKNQLKSIVTEQL